MDAFQELQHVRTTAPLSGEDVFDPDLTHSLPRGQEGTIVHVHHGGVAFLVEFILGEEGPDGIIEDPQYCELTLKPDQLEAVS